MDGAGHVEERLIYRNPFDDRGEIAQDIDDLVAEALVLAEVTRHEHQAGA